MDSTPPAPRPRMSRGRRWLLIGVGVVVVLLVLLTALSGFFVDVLWFGEVGFSQVFWKVLGTKALLGLIFGIVFFAILYANLLIARRLTPRYRVFTSGQEIIDRYRMAFEPHTWWLLPLVSGVISLFVAFGVTTEWRTFLLWRNSGGVAFGTPDPLFGRDPAFYIFTLPWLRFVQGWLFSSLVGVTIITAIAHYLWGGIRPQAPGLGEKVTPQVKAHLSVLLGLIVLTKAWGYYLGQFVLLTSKRGVVEGASYTDVNAQLPALRILAFIAIACAILFLVNIRMRGWALPVIALGLLVLVSVVAGAAYPAFVQAFRVNPQELQRERPYIADNIEATREAFDLTDVETRDRVVQANVTPADVKENALTLSNIRLWRPDVMRENFASFQRIRQYYEFNDVDVDRYVLDGQRRVVMLSAREVSQDGIPGGGGTWQNRHLVYTHGFGAVAAPVNTATPEGAPNFTLRDIPPRGQPVMEGNGERVYFSEISNVPYVAVNTGSKELDYQGTTESDNAQVTYTYDGSGGIPIENIFRKALFAWHFRDINLLISSLITNDSRILMNLELRQRVPKVAPFLRFDSDPYAAIVDGRLVWIWDAYTATDAYPYSQEIPLLDITQGALSGSANYIRNSVKVVVDAFDGTMKYYVADPNDPIIQVWSNAFPDMFSRLDEAPPSLLEHFRYPENLMQVQASQYANYHVTDPTVFYGKQDFWQIPADPTIANQIGEVPMRPYYVLMRLPGEIDETFVLILPFTPQGRQNLVAWMAAKSDPGPDFGDLVSYVYPTGEDVVDGPSLVFSRINQDARFSAERTLLGQGGSQVLFGDFLIIPINDGLLYVQPVYVRSAQTNAVPELKRVVIVNGGTVGLGSTIREALASSFTGQAPSEGGGGGGGGGGNVESQIQSLLQQASSHFAAADQALKNGDLATYQSEISAAQEAVSRASELAQQLAGVPAAPTPAPSASPTAAPSPTG